MGTLVLHVDDNEVARHRIRTQAGTFGIGSALSVGRGISPSPDHELEVRSWLARD